jgi:hypothetical protein
MGLRGSRVLKETYGAVEYIEKGIQVVPPKKEEAKPAAAEDVLGRYIGTLPGTRRSALGPLPR